MRTSTRRELTNLVRSALDEFLSAAADESEKAQDGRQQELLSAISEVTPVQVDLDQDLADRIVEKLHGPLTIPQHFSDWIKKEAEFHPILSTHIIGYGSAAGQAVWNLNPNGTLTIEMRDVNGARLWIGTFVPPDWDKADA